MFDISVTREFELWYQALEAPAAEYVASQLDLLERMGPDLDVAKSSRLLLWFDGVPRAEHAAGPPPEVHSRDGLMRALVEFLPLGQLAPAGNPAALALRAQSSELAQLVRKRDDALRCLETPVFVARFENLEPAQAARAQELIAALRHAVRAATLELNLEYSSARRRGTAPAEQAAGVRRDPVQEALADVLSFVGLRRADVADLSSGLRELTLDELAPHCRIIYGIDTPRRRILALVGEALDRAYYGDTVRFAERRWRDYCRDAASQSSEAR
jgi:hypothetical protein